MNILVTGANGQLGNEVRIVARKSPDHYIFTDVNQQEDQETTYLDITNLEAIRSMVKENAVDVIINCAAWTNVDAAETAGEIVETLNAIAPTNLAQVMKEVNGLLIHISTDYVFGGDIANTPCREDQQGTPTSVYGLTKLHGEQGILRSGCKHVIIRTAWLYSEFGRNFCKTMLHLTATKPLLKVVFDQVGTPTYTPDLAVLLADMIVTEKYGFYHATNEGGYISWYDFTVEIYKQAGYTTEVAPVTTAEYGISKAARPFNSRLDKSKLVEAGFEPLPTWQDALSRYLKEIDF